MERNPTDDMGTSGTSGTSATSGTETSSFGATGQGGGAFADTAVDSSANTTSTSGFSGTEADDTTRDGGSRLDQAKSTVTDTLGQARDMASERLGQAKEKATQLKATLADRLEAGAQNLRERANRPQLAGAGADGGATGLLSDDQLQRFAAPAADAMQKTADFLREGDLKDTLEEQVRTNPGRSLLIALGIGYVIGKALRR
jgi:hypothetical protein